MVRTLDLVESVGIVRAVVDGHRESGIGNGCHGYVPSAHNPVQHTIHVSAKPSATSERKLVHDVAVDSVAHILPGRSIFRVIVA